MVNDVTKEVLERFTSILTPENHAALSVAEWKKALKLKFPNQFHSKTLVHPVPHLLYRGRINCEPFVQEENFRNSQQLWAPPENLCKQGRCNKNGQSLLYCSIDSSIIVFELRPSVGDEFTIMEYRCLKELGPLCMVGIKEIHEKHKTLSGKILDYYNDLSVERQLIDYAIGVMFKSDKQSSFPELYNITNAITSIYLDDQRSNVSQDKMLGLIYPSITHADFYGVNVVLVPELAKKILKPVVAYKYKVLAKYKEYSYKIIKTHSTERIPRSGILKWKKETKSQLEIVGYNFSNKEYEQSS